MKLFMLASMEVKNSKPKDKEGEPHRKSMSN